MRTSLDFPDELFRHLKTRAALEGSTLRDLVIALVERGLIADEAPKPKREAVPFPSVSLGSPMALPASEFTNARLSEFLDE
ncbi:MAG: hypothetical protein V4757_06270 [Pseudomonadota bacterium]